MRKSRKTAAKIELATTRRTSLSWYKLRNSGLSRTPYRTEVSPRVVINLRIDTWQDVSWATSSGDSPSSGNIFGCYFGVGKKNIRNLDEIWQVPWTRRMLNRSGCAWSRCLSSIERLTGWRIWHLHGNEVSEWASHLVLSPESYILKCQHPKVCCCVRFVQPLTQQVTYEAPAETTEAMTPLWFEG